MADLFAYNAVTILYIAGGAILVDALIAIVWMPKKGVMKAVLFWIIAGSTIIGTLYLAGKTISANKTSATKGPVHWHADFRLFVCGEEFDLTKPSGFSNRIGEPVIHEHGDKRIHIEGVLQNIEEASLKNFFRVIGGRLSSEEIIIPSSIGPVSAKNGDICEDGSTGKVQAFLWQTRNGLASQYKISDFENYVLTRESAVPPGDCLIVEFGPEKTRTENICYQYEIAESRGDIKIMR